MKGLILKILFLIFIYLVVSGCREKEEKVIREEYVKFNDEKVSIIKLIATPQFYRGRNVQVKGFVKIEFEDSAIYLSKIDSEEGISKNAVWLQIPKKDLGKFSNLNSKYVILQGTFNDRENGHEGNYSGSIHSISSIKIISE